MSNGTMTEASSEERRCGEPELAVLLPIFNAQETLADALDSLLRQTHRAFRVIAVDDGSTDATREILAEAQILWSREAMEGGPRLKVMLHAAREGIVPNFNETDRTREQTRERPDLCQQYRPIGIGAVAAAFTAAQNVPARPANGAANSNERIGSDGSRAA